MLHFESDYVSGAHEKVLEAIVRTNHEKLGGYGSDIHSKMAKEKIRKICKAENADIYFISGGTQTNLVVISSLLKSYEGVVSVETGHISVHEAGAVEFTGHKVLTLPSHEGKIKPDILKEYMKGFYDNENREHMVFPGMVYISQPTEYGTLYNRKELEEISEICKSYGMTLYLDGARLGYALEVEGNDVDLAYISEVCDVFYIGGTKIGALCGEAVVFPKGSSPRNFVTVMKQHGALLAKGRLLGVQFDVLFSDNLYLNIGRHAVEMAMILKYGMKEKGYRFYIDSPTNQQFVIVENSKLEKFSKKVSFSFWERYDKNHTIIRLATSWSTTREEVERLLKIL